MGSNVEVRLLGPLEVVRDGAPVVVAAPKQRALLALFALDVGRVVSSDELADRLWAGDAPATAVTTLQVYVSQLRKLVGAERIVTQRPGYLLDLAADAVDVVRFEALAGEGRSLLAGGEMKPACGVLEEALSLWHGAALAEFLFEEWAAGPARRLEELRVTVREDLLDAKLGLGLGREMVGELETLVAEFPLRERLRSQLMLALYRSGRQADALAVYQDARRALVDELGIDPSSTLADLERRILQQDPTLGDAGKSVTVTTDPPATPRLASDAPGWRASCIGVRRSGRALHAGPASRAQGGDGAVLRPGGVHRRVRFQ